MKRILHLSAIALLLFVCNTALAQTQVVFNAAEDATPIPGSGAFVSTKDGVSLTIPAQTNFKDQHNYRIYKTNTFTVSTTIGRIKSIDFVVDAIAQNKRYMLDGLAGEGFTTSDKGAKGHWTGDASSVTLTATKHQVRFKTMTVTLEGTGSILSAPMIEGVTPFVGSTEVTLTGAAGSTIHYTTDGTEPSTASPSGASPLKITINNTCTVKAIAALNGNSSTVASKDFTATTYTEQSIEALHQLTVNQKFVSLVLTAAKVVYVNGKTIHVREGDKAVMLYNTKLSFPVNTILSGMLKCDFEYYHGIPEVKDNANTNQDDLMAIPAGDATLSPIEATIDEINAKKYLCDLVKLSDVKITSETADGRTSYYAVSGEKKVVLFKNEDKYKQLANNGKTYTIVALFNAIFKNTSELQPVEITEATTGIESIESDTIDTQAPLFNTAGQRVDKDYKGVVIQNGKKYINR